MTDTSYRIVIADDHPLFRGALREAVSGSFVGAEIAEAGSFEETSTLLDKDADVDLILLDLRLPDRRGLDVCRDIRSGSIVNGSSGMTANFVKTSGNSTETFTGYTKRVSGNSRWKRSPTRNSTSCRASAVCRVPRRTPVYSI